MAWFRVDDHLYHTRSGWVASKGARALWTSAGRQESPRPHSRDSCPPLPGDIAEALSVTRHRLRGVAIRYMARSPPPAHPGRVARDVGAVATRAAAGRGDEPMSIYYNDDTVTLHEGNCLTVLPTLPTGSVDCIVTSPPYFGLRDYGHPDQHGLEESPAQYVETMRSVFAECRRVLADDGTLWLNLGDSYYSGRGNPGPNAADTKQPARRGMGSPRRPARASMGGTQEPPRHPVARRLRPAG